MNILRRTFVIDILVVLMLIPCAVKMVHPVFDALGKDQLEGRFGVVLFSFRAPVMFAAGHGMRNLDCSSFPEIEAFFNGKASSADIAVIPKDYRGFPLSESYALMHFYLLYAIGWAWRLFGVSYHSLHLLCMFLYVVSMLLIYALFRLGAGRLISAACTLIIAASPAFLMSCPSLRDFSKTPFLLGCFWLLGILLAQGASPRRLYAWSALYAVIAGVGFGFRQDLLICVPAAIVVVLLFAQVEGGRQIKARLISTAVLSSLFLFVAAPVLYGTWLDRGSSSAQSFVQGVSAAVESKQRFGHASYVQHYDYGDYYDFSILNAYARRTGLAEPMPGHFTAAYGKAGGRYMREMMAQFPADLFARGLASCTSLSGVNAAVEKELPFINQSHGPFLRARAELYQPLAEHFRKWGTLYLLLAVLTLSLRNMRLALALAFLGLYFGAYPSLLYDFRHYFHLSFAPLWAAAYLTTVGLGFAAAFPRRLMRRNQENGSVSWPKRMACAIALMLFVACSLCCTLLVLRAVQTRNVRSLAHNYEDAHKEEVPFVWTRFDGKALLQPATTSPNFEHTAALPPFEAKGEYLALRLSNIGQPLSLFLAYEKSLFTDFSQVISPQPGLIGESGEYWYYFPAYELAWPSDVAEGGVDRGKFIGIAIPDDQRHAVRGLYRICQPEVFSLWPFIAIPDDMEAFIDHKSGDVELFLSWTLRRLKSIWRDEPHAQLKCHLALMRQYPGYVPFKEDAFSIIGKTKEAKTTLDLWSLLLKEFPQYYPEASTSLEALVEQVCTQIDLTQASWKQFVDKDLWSRTRFGLKLQEHGQGDAAQELFQSAVEESPEFRFAAENLDQCLLRASDRSHRIDVWRAIHQCHPRAGLPRLYLGMALREAGRYDEAEQIISAMINDNAAYASEAQMQLGGIAALRGNIESGIAMIAATAATYPGLNSRVEALYADLGRHFMEKKEYEQAARMYSHAMEYAPDNLWRRVARGDAWAALEKYDLARQDYEAVLEQAPESPYSAAQLDHIYVIEDNKQMRHDFWMRLCEKHPDAAAAHLYLGKAQEDAGQQEQAIALFQKALSLNPELTEARDRLAALHFRQEHREEMLPGEAVAE